MFVKVLVSRYLNINSNFLLILFFSVAPKPTLPTDIGSIDDVTDASINNGFFQSLGDTIKQYGAYLRDKFLEIIERIRNKFKQIGSKISNHFNSNG